MVEFQSNSRRTCSNQNLGRFLNIPIYTPTTVGALVLFLYENAASINRNFLSQLINLISRFAEARSYTRLGFSMYVFASLYFKLVTGSESVADFITFFFDVVHVILDADEERRNKLRIGRMRRFIG